MNWKTGVPPIDLNEEVKVLCQSIVEQYKFYKTTQGQKYKPRKPRHKKYRLYLGYSFRCNQIGTNYLCVRIHWILSHEDKRREVNNLRYEFDQDVYFTYVKPSSTPGLADFLLQDLIDIITAYRPEYRAQSKKYAEQYRINEFLSSVEYAVNLFETKAMCVPISPPTSTP